MSEILKTTLIGLFFGTFGTTIGGIIGVKFKKHSNKFLSFVLSFAAGLMLSIVCFDLIPEALKKWNKKISDKGTMLKTGLVISLGLAIHNFPEGLAIGSGFEASTKLGLSLALAICFHDIPEGISMAVPMKNGGMKISKVMIYVILSGIATGIGALVGSIIGKVSEKIIAICLSFAAGAMLYIVSGELIPESNKLYKGRMSAIGNIIGFIIGMAVTRI